MKRSGSNKPDRADGPRVRLVEAGGVAGVRRVCEAPLADLPPGARRGLRHAFAASLRRAGPARDLKTYRLTLADARGPRDVLFDEATLPAAARPLVRWLSQRATPGWA